MTQPPRDPPQPVTVPACPFCNSIDTELFAWFGQFLLASPYYCRSCKTVFDVVRWEEPARTTPPEGSQELLPDGSSSNRA
jgi:hypothetical protein